jgi:hypothetical protein
MKLVLVSKTNSQAWYRTEDGKFDILGEDLNTNTPAGRAAGAGAVWFWRPAKATRDWTDYHSKAFARKPDCIADLEQHLAKAGAAPALVKVIIKCVACGQRNRVIVGTEALCGKCKAPIAGLRTMCSSSGVSKPNLGNFAQRLATADAMQAFGRLTQPENYVVCPTCGVTYHKRDAHSCA